MYLNMDALQIQKFIDTAELGSRITPVSLSIICPSFSRILVRSIIDFKRLFSTSQIPLETDPNSERVFLRLYATRAKLEED